MLKAGLSRLSLKFHEFIRSTKVKISILFYSHYPNYCGNLLVPSSNPHARLHALLDHMLSFIPAHGPQHDCTHPCTSHSRSDT